MAEELSRKKARQILHDREVRGHSLTERQRRFFGARASGYARKRKRSRTTGRRTRRLRRS